MIRLDHRKISSCFTVALLLAIPVLVVTLLLRREGHVDAAKTALRQYRFGEARWHLQAALKAEPENPELVLLAAQAARRDCDFDEAKRFLEEAERLHGAPGTIELERLLISPQGRDFKKWEKGLWAQIDENHLQSALVLEALAAGYAARHRREKALACLELHLSSAAASGKFNRGISKEGISTLFLRGRLLECMSAFNDAERDYRRVLELDSNHDEARYHLGLVLYATSRAPEAIKQLEGLLRQQSLEPAVFVLLARCHSELSNDGEAKKLLDAVLKKYPSDVHALSERGKLAFQAGDGLDAERWLVQAVKASPWNRQAHHMLYLCLNQLGKEREAQALLPKLQQIEAQSEQLMEIPNRKDGEDEPEDPDLSYEIAEILFRKGQGEFALHWLKEALKSDPKHRPTHKLLADYYEKTGNGKRAELHRELAEGK